MNNESDKKSPRAQREEQIMQFWRDNNTFQKSLERHAPLGEFIFYEGPPGVNGVPMSHHFESRAFKDVLPRYKTMRGYRCDRRAGWDCHGLPVELQTEKELGITKSQIEEIGIDVYNDHCRSTVGRYTAAWETFSERMGYWIDYDRAYFTMHSSYIESCWNIVAQAHNRGYLYQDYKVLPWCTSCGTSLSSHELGQPGAYRDIKELSLIAKFKLSVGQSVVNISTDTPAYVLAWTTTPWTLPGNVALAVGGDIEYSCVRSDGDVIVMATALLETVMAGKEYIVITTVLGHELAGLRYEPLFPYMSEMLALEPALEKAFKIYTAPFVTTTTGTGVVHTAVMYGADDFDLGTQVGLPKMHIINEDGTYKQGCDFLTGRHVKEKSHDGTETVAIDIIKNLAGRGLLWKKEKYEHSYPHCWRCSSPLLYIARSSWYFRMSALREKLLEINSQINWEPAHVKEGRFGAWLDEIKDWAISRSRYWGTPLPVWQTESGDKRYIVGGLDDLRALTKRSGNKYYAMRHGESLANISGVWCVSKDDNHGLTAAGKEQVRHATEKLKELGITKVILSPFVRTQETAAIVQEVLQLSEESLIVDSRVAEYNPGVQFEGMSHDDANDLWHQLHDPFTESFAGGESLQNLHRRTGELLFEMEEKYDNETILIVTHMSPIVMMQYHAASTTISPLQFYRDKDDFVKTYIQNAEYIPIDFVPYPHNNNYELDLHKPYIDTITLQNPEGETLTRVLEVMDVWFDSGCMPLAQDHYPFENADLYERKQYPADFICEGLDQTRGWFYTLVAVAALIGVETPFKNAICLGLILDAHGQKMSKSKGNTIDSFDIMNRFGADILRWWMYSVTQPGDSKNFEESMLVEIQNKVFNMLDNCVAFWLPYRQLVTANGYTPGNYVLDDWVVVKLRELHAFVTLGLDSYKIFEPVRAIREFIADLSQWYIRRSRERLKMGSDTEKASVASTLQLVFSELAKIMAPFTPFYSESLWQELYGAESSVHLESWSEIVSYEESVLADMDVVRNTVSLALEKRARAGIKVRQPLSRLVISNKYSYLSQAHLDIIAEELNVKYVTTENNGPTDEVVLDTVLTPELLAEGDARELMRTVQELRKRAGFVPSDEVVIILSDFPQYLQPHRGMIKKVTGASDMIIGEGSTEVALHDGSMVLVEIR